MAVVTTLVNAVSTQNAAGTFTNGTQTAFNATTSAFALHATVVAPTGTIGTQPPSHQTSIRIWFAAHPDNVTAAAFAQSSRTPMCFDVPLSNMSGGTSYFSTDAIAAMGTYLYCWVEMPSITAANGTLTVKLFELN